MRLYIVTWKFCYSRKKFSLLLYIMFSRVKNLKHSESDCIEIFVYFYCYKQTVEHDFKFVLIRCLKLKDLENKMDFN